LNFDNVVSGFYVLILWQVISASCTCNHSAYILYIKTRIAHKNIIEI